MGYPHEPTPLCPGAGSMIQGNYGLARRVEASPGQEVMSLVGHLMASLALEWRHFLGSLSFIGTSMHLGNCCSHFFHCFQYDGTCRRSFNHDRCL